MPPLGKHPLHADSGQGDRRLRVNGYPGDPSCEWATAYLQTVGNWLELRWDTPRIVDRIVLYDRPNTSDNIVSGTVTSATAAP